MIDAAFAALLGAVIGGVIGVIGTILTNQAAARRELASFKRASSRQHVDRLRSTYEFALNVLFNLERSGNPDWATYGDMFARVSLYGSEEVKRILDAYLKPHAKEAPFDIQCLIQAMKSHLEELERIHE